MERFNERRYIIVPRNVSQNIEQFFSESEELHFVTDLLLLIPCTQNDQENFVYELKTHKYVGTSDNNKLILLDIWFSNNKSFLNGANLYPDKLTNQLGRPLKMVTFTYEPYSIIGESLEEHHGSELMSGLQFTNKYNMTPVFKVSGKDDWGELYSNYTGSGLLGNLVEDNADIGFAALYTWENCYHFLDLSKPLVRTGITCLVPAPRLAARWLTPLISYSPKLWFCVIAILLFSTVVLSLILRCYNRNKTMIQGYPPQAISNKFVETASHIVLKPIFAQSLTSSETPDHISSKLMTTLMIILGLFLTSTYSSGLATVMTLPRYERAIDTVEDLAESGLQWGATTDAWLISMQDLNDTNYLQMKKKFRWFSEEELRVLSKTGSFGFSLERLPFENFAVGDYIKEDVIGNFHLMQQDLYWEQCVIMLRKNSVLLPTLDSFILRIFQAGLISVWQNKAANRFMNAYVQRAIRFYTYHLQEHQVVKLNWGHVEGAFGLLVLGLCASLLVFIMELICLRKGAKYRVM